MSVRPLVLLLLVALGAVAAYEDWRVRRIRNLWIALGLAGGAAALLAMLANSLLAAWGPAWLRDGLSGLPFSIYPLFLLHGALCASAALVLWRLNVWPAGDAKLFLALGWLAGLAEPGRPGFPSFLFLILLINIFVPAGLGVLAVLAALGLRRLSGLRPSALGPGLRALAERAAIRAADRWPYRRRYALFLLNAFLLFTASTLIGRRLPGVGGGVPGRAALFFGLYLFWGTLSRLLRRGPAGTAGLAALAAALARGVAPGAWPAVLSAALRSMLLFWVFLGALRWGVDRVLRARCSFPVRAGELEAGMILAPESWELAAAAQGGRRAGWTRPYADGLSEQEASALRSEGGGLAGRALTAYRAVPFAAWILLGTLLTLTAPGHAVLWLKAAWRGAEAAWGR